MDALRAFTPRLFGLTAVTFLALFTVAVSPGWAQIGLESVDEADESEVDLEAFVLSEARVANIEPATGLASPVSDLRYEPRVDLQTRNFGEAQGDISVRGGIFEGTAVQVGGVTVYDPQTGHYAAELPIASEMLASPMVWTGVDHALSGMNATAGTIGYGWRRVRSGGELSVGVGNGGLWRGSVYVGQVLRDANKGDSTVAFDLSMAASTGAGTLQDGDHRLRRFAGRVVVTTPAGETQLFAGHQSKFFGWPNLYTPYGVAETEDIATTLALLSHRWDGGDGVSLEGSLLFRRNEDDYEFDRHRPGLYNPYQHDTRVCGGALRATIPTGAWTVDLRAEGAADSIESTSLVAGRFNSRTMWKLGALARRDWRAPGEGHWETRLGASYDDTNRETGVFSPMAELAWVRQRSGTTMRLYGSYAESSRVPGYTALNSSPTAGLFRGNPDLGREKSGNAELGAQLGAGAWSMHAAVFTRRDDPMIDWTFTVGAPNARTAREVGVETTGVEIVGTWSRSALRVVVGYTWLTKDADYFGAQVDASFYALNFARHRVTLAITATLGGGFELRSDNEYRIQEKNLLRVVGGDRAVLSSLGLYWVSSGRRGIELSFVADNLWESDFQELPAVPAPGRQITGGVRWRW